jgi:hypothetical protein
MRGGMADKPGNYEPPRWESITHSHSSCWAPWQKTAILTDIPNGFP